ncbi:hypothetical protein [Paraglaciecola chathamensis]|uniref:Uncharacterized protein n=1 Tax=Paraglaciecola chathamensis TaxID=368405 RepID=A0A8H9M5V8_9ALTE|nr:hypothetical protein [Paraglaciecola oceanifecundans]GGZ83211.1 hypothetical protein GCM10011274_46050 [Paraglaciecola oceanifecundans]
MLGFKKKDGTVELLKALNDVQAYLVSKNNGSELSLYQHGVIPETVTFKLYGESFEKDGFTRTGGLLKYCNNALNKVLEAIENGEPPAPIVVHIAEKMAHVVGAIPLVKPEDEMNDMDRALLSPTMALAAAWLDHDKRPELMAEINARVDRIQANILSKENVKNFVSKQRVNPLESLTSW